MYWKPDCKYPAGHCNIWHSTGLVQSHVFGCFFTRIACRHSEAVDFPVRFSVLFPLCVISVLRIYGWYVYMPFLSLSLVTCCTHACFQNVISGIAAQDFSHLSLCRGSWPCRHCLCNPVCYWLRGVFFITVDSFGKVEIKLWNGLGPCRGLFMICDCGYWDRLQTHMTLHSTSRHKGRMDGWMDGSKAFVITLMRTVYKTVKGGR